MHSEPQSSSSGSMKSMSQRNFLTNDSTRYSTPFGKIEVVDAIEESDQAFIRWSNLNFFAPQKGKKSDREELVELHMRESLKL